MINEQKTITVPDGWEQVSIRQAQEIKAIDKDNKDAPFEIISILVDEDVEEVRKYDVRSLELISENLGWINELPKECKDIIEVDGDRYGLVRFSEMTGGEWSDLDQYLSDPINNLHKIIGLLYRPIIVEYDANHRVLEEYDTKSAEFRSNLFLDKVNFGDVYASVVFFCNIEKNCTLTIQAYFIREIAKMNRKKTRVKESKDLQKKPSKRSGDGTNIFTRLLRGTLQRLKK